MSGQPNQTPMDASKFRQAYMGNLNLRIALDDKNLQANKVYNRTGQMPVEPSDFRTTEEKLADVLTLRKEVRSELGKIADGPNANKISVELTPAELVFYYQQSLIVNQLIIQRYSKGVLANIFIPFLQKYMADSLANKGVASGLQQVSAPNLLLSGENIARALATEQDYKSLLESYMNTGISITVPIKNAIMVLPPTDLFQKINAVTNENERFKLLEETTNYLKDLPSKAEISSKIREIQRLKNIRDTSGLKGETGRVIQLITPSPDTKIQMNNILTALGETAMVEDTVDIVEPESVDNPIVNIAKKVTQFSDLYNLTNNERILLFVKLDLFGKNNVLGFSKSKVDNSAKKFIDLLRQLEDTDTNGLIMYKISEYITNPSSMGGTGMKNSDFEITGNGLVRINKPKRYDMIKKTDIDTSMGIEKQPRYIPFGRYFINRNRLNDGVVSIKRPSGGSIVEFPSQRVSTPLVDVLKKIVGKGIPAFEDLEALTDEEKMYLHKLAKESHIIDRISIPTPKKGDTDKDLNRFEILKGQIMSGNDNKELIKEFKLLIMKLSGLKIIPKTQARDILFDLTSMGY